MTSARVEIDEHGIATIQLNAPGKRVNTLSRQMWKDLAAAIDQIERDQPTHIIITSAKPGTFVVGADLHEIREMTDEQFDEYILVGQQILQRLENLPMPTTAAINGDCLGGGLELAMACKTLVAVNDLKIRIGLPETKLGLVPGWGGTVRLTRRVGLKKSLHMMIAGEMIDPSKAEQVGLLDAIAPEVELREIAITIRHRQARHKNDIEILDDLEDRRAASLALVNVLRQQFSYGEQSGFDAERRAIAELRRTPECQEKMQEFFDRKNHKAD